MFPSGSCIDATQTPRPEIDLYLIEPLTRTEFLETVLVREVTVHLISEDLNLDLQKARKALEDSAEYGRCKFPATNEDIKQHLI
jgi:hypothetical protein